MDAYREEYENYEPELKVWPYITLGLLVPSVPFITNILFYNNGLVGSFNLIYSIVFCVVLATAYFVTANVIRTARGSWVYAILSSILFLLNLVLWSYYKLKGVDGYPLSRPFLVANIPAFTLLVAYSFYAKRSRLPAWGTSALLTFFYGVGTALYVYFLSDVGEVQRIIYVVYASLVAVLSLFMFFVTKRSEAAPWYINIVLILLVFASIAASPGFTESLSSPSSTVIYIFKSIAINYNLWFFISICFVFAGLGMKSCFKTLNQDEEDLDELVTRVNSRVIEKSEEKDRDYPEDDENSFNTPVRKYSYPPENDRFANFSKRREEDEYEDEPRYRERPQRERRPEYRDERERRRDYRDYPEDRYDEEDDYRPRRSRPQREYDEYDEYDDYYDRAPRRSRDRDDYYRDDEYRPRREREERYTDRRPMIEDGIKDDYRRSKRYSNERDKWLELLSTGGEDNDYDDRR